MASIPDWVGFINKDSWKLKDNSCPTSRGIDTSADRRTVQKSELSHDGEQAIDRYEKVGETDPVGLLVGRRNKSSARVYRVRVKGDSPRHIPI